MAEYIERELAIHEVQNDSPEMVYYSREDAVGCINSIPAADVAPVTHAHVVVNWLGDCHCSNCGEDCNCTKPFCASCGARFDEPETRED